jgi:O-methyltransferase
MPATLMSLGYMLYRARGAYFQDGLLSVHNSDFRKDRKFREAYRLGKATGSWGRQDVEWRAYVCCWAAWSVREKEGDFVECGVNRGGYSRTVMHYVDFDRLDKRFWLLDTYEGLVDRLILEDERRLGILAGGYDPCYEQVMETFRLVPGARIVKGVIPDTLAQVTANKICYLSIDMNNAAPEIAAAEYFWDVLVSGGVIVRRRLRVDKADQPETGI